MAVIILIAVPVMCLTVFSLTNAQFPTNFIRGNGQSQFCTPTAQDIIGPYFKPNAPLQVATPSNPASICQNSPAHDRVFLNGTVRLTPQGQTCGTPVRALLEVWHADVQGIYSDISPSSPDFGCRLSVFTTDAGAYSIVSTFPGRYMQDTGYRPAHVHFRITPVDRFNQPTGQTFTTQMYFAYDQFLSPNDSCGDCGSGQPTLIAHVQHVSDIKTYVGSWDVLIPNQFTPAEY